MMRAHRTLLLVLPFISIAIDAQQSPPAILGRWDFVVTGSNGTYPSWLEVTTSGRDALVGRFVGQVGSARPIARVEVAANAFHFAIPNQYEEGNGDLRVDGKIDGERLTGIIVNPNGTSHAFTATHAPSMRRTTSPVWGEPIELFNGKDLTGWTTQGGGVSKWTAVNGVLTNSASGANLMTTRSFADFKLHLEFRYPKGGNSGVYLRGRHEVQIEDSPERESPLSTHIGGVYGFLTPNENAATAPGEWQTYDITLIGRRVTVVLNGKSVITDQVIPGITGGALDSNEGAPGPILLQGDHTAVEYRNVRLTPAK
ncbi:MAG: 3-keto-disaccharide hydrolase [Gemmatimonadaceae bacterium]